LSWLLCDYGEVLSSPQPSSERAALVAASGCTETEFWGRYRHHRALYDRADVSAAEYWASVLGLPVANRRLEELIALDVASWLHPNRDTLAGAKRAGRRGYKLAILSNAPADVADALDSVPWLSGFEPRLFSCRLRSVKPDAAVFRQAVHLLGAQPEDIVFFDDRLDNVAAATAIGIRAHHFSNPSQLDSLPPL
jgi:putative hydrolase of the HAD superfamily